MKNSSPGSQKGKSFKNEKRCSHLPKEQECKIPDAHVDRTGDKQTDKETDRQTFSDSSSTEVEILSEM